MFEEKLIEEVRQRPCLYDIKSPDYRRAHIKKRIWGIIAIKLNVDALVCKSKWRPLRDRYKMELASLELPSDAGLSAKKPWQYMKQLSFLKSNLTSKSKGDDAIKEDPNSAVAWEGAGFGDRPQTETFSPRSLAGTLLSKSPSAILLPKVITASSSCTVIQDPPKRSFKYNPYASRKTLEKKFRRFLSDVSKSLQKKTAIDYFMLSIAGEVEKLKWSLKQRNKFRNKVKHLILEMDAAECK